MFYAQNGEDKWLAENWGQLGLPDRGFFVEVGVGDGVNISNTLWLEERGWDGLLIEPDTRHHANIQLHRKAMLVPHAVGTGHNRAFTAMANPEYSGFLRPAAEGVSQLVVVRGLSEILDARGVTVVDVLSLDTEGTELEVWSTLDLIRFRPLVVLVEWNTDGLSENKEGVIAQFDRDGYRCAAELGCNLAMVPR